jgi:hypothetical protein
MQAKLATMPAPDVPLTEADKALLFLVFLLETLHDESERDFGRLDALATQILDERPKTMFGLTIRACAAKWLRRHLWKEEFGTLPQSDKAARVVIDSAMRLAGQRA